MIQMCLNLLLYTYNFQIELRGNQPEEGLLRHKAFARSKADLNRKRKFPFLEIRKTTYKMVGRIALEPVQIFTGRE
jgi:hypothetical protein